MSKEMPKGGVNELLKSPSGRKYLEELQKRHWKDRLQPGDKMFERVWGDKIKKRKEDEERQVRKAEELRAEAEERKAFERGDNSNRWDTKGKFI